MRKTWLIIILIVLFLVGCRSTTPPPSGTAPTTDETDQTTSVTDIPSQPSNTPSDPTVESTSDVFLYELYEMYVWHPDEIYVFDYTEGEQPYGGPGKVFDLSKLDPGHLYVNDVSTDTLTHITGPVIEWAITLEHLYFILEAEPTKVYRTNYQGEEKVLLVDVADFDLFDDIERIDTLSYAGTDAYGKLLFKVDGQKVIQYDLKEQAVRLLMEQNHISYFYYLYPDQWGNTGKGPKLHWSGYDEEGKLREYLYFVETGENIPFQN